MNTSQLKEHRYNFYTGSVEKETYYVGFVHLHKVGETSFKNLLLQAALKEGRPVRSVPKCQSMSEGEIRRQNALQISSFNTIFQR